MPAKVLMDVEEYLQTTFEGSDCEFLDGEIVERNRGELSHGIVQMEIAYLLRNTFPPAWSGFGSSTRKRSRRSATPGTPEAHPPEGLMGQRVMREDPAIC